MNKISQEDFDEWLDNTITQEVLKLIQDEAHSFREMAAGGVALNADNFAKVGEKYFSLINTAMVYENLLENLTFENVFLKEEIIDDNNVSTSGEQTPS